MFVKIKRAILQLLPSDCTTNNHCKDDEICQIKGEIGSCSNPCDSFETYCQQNQTCIVTNREPSCERKYFLIIYSNVVM